MNPQSNMSNSFDGFLLTNLGDVTVERVHVGGDARDATKRVQADGQSMESKEMMDNRQTGNDDCSEDSTGDTSENGRRKKVAPMRTDEIEEIRTEGSADDMDLDETIDSHIGVRMETERQHIQSLLSDENEEEEDEDEDIGIDSVNILDTLPLEGAPIEGQEVSEADLLGKINDDDDEDEEDKSLSRSGEEDSLDAGKRRGDHDDGMDPAKKKQKKEDGAEGSSELETNKSDKKLSNMRRNIREVMDETQLDEATLAAQRQEMERLRRVQEQQRIIREVQRRQASRGVSLLRSNQSEPYESEVRLPSTVMLKVNSGSAGGGVTSAGQQAMAARRPMAESSRWQRGRDIRGYEAHQQAGAQTSISRVPARPGASNVLQQRIRMMTPSVSISPVVPKKEPIEHLEYYTDSDLSDVDAEADDVLAHEKQLQQARKLSGVPKPGQKLAKGKDVVTISSSSESSDDDCIVLSDPSEVEETDNEDDPSNSGMHTNDRYNIPDEQGRVLVNVGHPEDEPDVFLAPQVARIIKPHQIGGIRFLYDNIVESIERFKTSSGFGCILAHSMGLGKTLQVASFCDIFFRCTDAKTVLCIMPINTLQNWLAEFNMWLPYEDINKPKMEEKAKVKEESNLSNQDSAYVSRPGSEHDPNSQQQASGMMTPESNPYAPQHGYGQGMMPHYGPTGGMYDPRYGPAYSGPTGYSPIKTENPCHPQQMNPYGMDARGMPQYNPAYPGNMQQPPVYPGMDPSIHPGAHGMNPMYPGYGANPNVAPYPSVYPGTPRSDGQEAKKMEGVPTDHRLDGQTAVKTEPSDEPKKESEEPKKESKEEKKDERVKTPYSVDVPPDLEVRPRHFSLHILNDSHKTMAARARVIREWQKVGGVLLIGYELYRQLSLKKPNKAKRKRGQPQPFKDPSADAEEEDKNKPLLDEMHVALVNPGPDLVICDEGHRIKNSHASISLALKQMRTKRRIVLTGYPLQNNLLEYWCMVDFVRPNYLGTKSEFCNMFERPIQNGQCIDSTPQDIRLMRYRAHVLHALLEGFVQRRSHSVLQVSLPRKEEYILLVRMTAHQRKLYDTFMNQVVKTRAVPNPLKAFAVCCKIWNHPDILYHFLRKRQANEEDDLDLEETMGDKATSGGGSKRAAKPRQPKGEGGRKGKKANPKNKPAASVQPNVSTENPEATKSQPQQPPYQSQFNQTPSQASSTNMPNSNTNFPGANASNYQQPQQQQQQQHGNYQNYRPEERGGTYHGGEYDYYGNQNQQSQQKYPTSTAQNFQQYPQNTNYPNQAQQQSQQAQQQQQQQYQGQPQQNYDASSTGQRFMGPSPTGSSPAPGSGNYRQEQNQQTPGNFPRQNYPYSGNMNQGQNYPGMQNQQSSSYQSQNQSSSQMGMSEYGSYPGSNTNQGYGNSTSNQPGQPNGMNYSSGQSQQNQGLANTQGNSNYMGGQQQNPTPGASGFNQNQQLSNSQHQQYPTASATPNSNQTLSYSASGMPYNSSQQQPPPQQQQHGYQSNAQQNQMRGYQNLTQSQTPGYNQPSQQHVYPNDAQQQQQQPNQQTQHQQSSQQHQPQQHGYNQQTPNYSPTSQVPPNQMGYSSNQQGSTTPYQANAQQSQTPTHAQNQPMNYPQGTPVLAIKTEPQQQSQQNVYPRSDSQTGYPNPSQGFPSTNPQLPPGGQGTSQQPPVQGQEQYWQRNYQNSNDQTYYNDPNVSQYQGNYQSATPGNYQNQQNQYRDYSANAMTDQKPPQQQPPQQQQPPPQQQSHMPTPGQPTGVNLSTQTLQAPTPNPPYGAPPIPALGSQVPGEPIKEEDKEREDLTVDRDKMDKDKEREDKSDDEIIVKDEVEKEKGLIGLSGLTGKEDLGIPYDWATELMKGYVPGLIDASAKMTLFFCILEEAIKLGDRVLAFSQSLFTLNLIEDFLARNDFTYKDGQSEAWQKNVNYYRLDGSTSALEREKLINEFNVNPKVHLFLVSTRAGSLGINLVGANRAIVFDASWNPCHDTQAVCRVYRYGQQKNCYVYRLVTDNCLERKIYDRQISKQGMADRVVDQCNPDAHLSLKEATTLSWDWEEDSQVQDFSDAKDKYTDEVMHLVLTQHSSLLTKQPFHHESLLVDRKDKKLSQAEKRLARRGYELEKMAANCSRPSYNYVPGNTAARVSVSSGSLQIRQIRGDGGGPAPKPVASVRPMQQRGAEGLNARNPSGSRWIPAEVWQRQGMSAQEMTLPLDVVIPTNSPDKGSIVLKAGQRVMVLKSPKGIYMQLESGKIIAIRTALKINQQKKEEELPKKSVTPAPQRNVNKQEVGFPLRNNSAISIIPKSSASNSQSQQNRSLMKTGANYRPFGEKEVAKRTKPVATATAKPYSSQLNSSQVSLSRINKSKQDQTSDVGSMGENSNSSDGHKVRMEQRVEEVRIEDVVAETGSSSEYSPSSRPANSDVETSMNMPRPLMDTNKASSNFSLENSPVRPPSMRTPQDAYVHEPKFGPQKKFDMGRGLNQKDRKSDASDEIIIEEPAQTPHQLHQPHLGHHHSQHAPQHQPQHPTQHQTQHPTQHQPQHSLHQPLQQSQHQIQHQSPHHPPKQTQHQPQQIQQHPPVHPPVHQPVPQHPHSSRTPSRPASQQGPRITSDVSLGGGKNLSSNAPSNTGLNQTSPTVPTTPAVPSRSKPTPAPSETAAPRETPPTSVEPAHGYPYAQYPRYYDYGDPRARPLADPYGSYFPPAATTRTNPEVTPAPQAPLVTVPHAKLVEEAPKPAAESQVYPARINAMPPKTSSVPDVTEAPVLKDPTSAPATAAAPPSIREDPHVPTAFSHPSSVRSAYPAPYPPTPYDPYSQHYPPAPASSAAYSAGTAPGYPAYGGPSYNADYARMYSAFHGPPPPGGDPYRSYARPPASHPSNYYPPFPHPPPPYPNYSFLPPYPNPNVPAEPQPPAQ